MSDHSDRNPEAPSATGRTMRHGDDEYQRILEGLDLLCAVDMVWQGQTGSGDPVASIAGRRFEQ